MKDREILISLHNLGIRNEKLLDFLPNLSLYSKDYSLFKMTLVQKLNKKEAELINKIKLEDIFSQVMENSEILNVEIFTIFDKEYPQELKYIENPPTVLYVKGNLQTALKYHRFGIVGARKHTVYGRQMCIDIVRALTNYNISIVSGMALGIDAISHNECLENGLPTIAVLGNGVDIIYPSSNRNIYFEILQHGAIISEYPLGSKSLPHHFPERNRIISGLSKGVIVIEAKERSGSLITARLAAEQGKEVFAVPGNINSIYSKGTNRLIQDGANLYLSVEDVISYFPEIKAHQNEDQFLMEVKDLSHEEKEILKMIALGKNTANLICNQLDFKISYVSSILTSLELKGYILEQGSESFTLNNEVKI